MRKLQKWISGLLCLVMLLGLCPVFALADGAQLSYDFEDDTAGAAPAGGSWALTTAENAEVSVEPVTPLGTTHALRLADQSSSAGSASASIPFTETPTAVSLDLRVESFGNDGTRRGFPVIDLRDSGNAIVARVTVNPVDEHTGVISYYTGSGTTYIDSDVTVSLDAWHTVAIDVANKTITVDGKQAFGSAAFLKSTAPSSLLILTTGKKFVNDVFYVDNISYTGATTHTEDFESTAVGSLPSNITPGVATNVTCAVAETTVADADADTHAGQALRIEDSSSSSNAVAGYTFGSSASVTVAFDFRSESANGANCISVYEGEERRGAISVFQTESGLTLRSLNAARDGWVDTTMTSVQRGKWYRMEMRFVAGAATAEVYVDGVKVCDMAVGANAGLSRLEFACNSSAANGDIYWIDNIVINLPDVVVGSAVGQMLNTSGSNNISNTWMFDGGAATVGSVDAISGARSYVYHFEDWMRWGNRQNTSTAATQRYVFNVAQEGQTLADSLAAFDDRAAELNPRAAVYLIGAEDCAAGAEGIEKFKADLTAYIGKAVALRGNSGYAVIQTPHPATPNAALYAAATVEAVEALSDEQKPCVMIINHTANGAWAAEHLNADGSLSILGHLEMARQLCAPIWGKALTDFPTETMKDNFPNLEVEPAPAAYLAEAASVTAGADSLQVTLPESAGEGPWVCTVETESYTLTANKTGKSFTVSGLPAGEAYTLTVTAADWSVQLPQMVGTVEAGSAAAPKTNAATALTELLESKDSLTWLFMGDSITHGTWHTGGYDSVSQSFEKYLRDDLGRVDDLVINTAVSGATAPATVSNLAARLENYTPDVVSIMLGCNDGRTNAVSEANFKAAMRTLIDTAQEKGALVILRTAVPTQYDDNTGVTDRVVYTRQVAAEYDNVLVVDQYALWHDMIAAEPYYSTVLFNDNLHPNGVGHLLMLKQFVEDTGLPTDCSKLMALEYVCRTNAYSRVSPQITKSGSDYVLDAAALEAEFGSDLSSVTLTATAANGDTYAVTGTADGTLTLAGLPADTYTFTVTGQLKNAAQTVTFIETNVPHVAFYTDEPVELDGKADEKWYFSGDFDGTPDGVMAALWDSDNLYFAIKTEDGESVTLTVNGKSVTEAVSAGLTELSLPLSTFGLKLQPADQTVDFKAVLTKGEAVTKLPATKLELRFSTAVIVPNTDSLTGWAEVQPHSNSTNILFTEANDGMHVGVADPAKTGIWARRVTASVPEGAIDIDVSLDIDDLPVITSTNLIAWRGLVVDTEPASGTRHRYAFTKDASDGSILLSYLMGPSDGTGSSVSYDTGLPVDSTFKVRLSVADDHSTKVYIDSVHVHTFPACEPYTGNISNAVEVYGAYFNCDTTKGVIDATVKDLAISVEAASDLLTFDDIKGKNTDESFVSYDLKLMDSISWGGYTFPVTWTSSDPAVLGHDGKIGTPADGGSAVTLTAVIDMGGSEATVTFSLTVFPGSDVDLYYRDDDRNPYTGTLNSTNILRSYTLDQTYNSIGVDLGSVQTVNRVILKDADGIHRIHEIDLAIYVSDDNETYTKVEDFALSASGTQLYLYNFSAEGRYVKVHCTYDGTDSASFTGPLNGMMWAGYDDAPVAAGEGTFRQLGTVKVAAEKSGDDLTAWLAYTQKNLAQALTECQQDLRDLRFVLDGQVLPYWLDDDGVYLRIPTAKAEETLTLEIWGGNEDAESISDADAVFEVTYGNRTIQDTTSGEFEDNTIVRVMPNGDLLAVANRAKMPCAMWYRRSTDGGRTWQAPQKITEIGESFRNEGAGWIEDGDRVWLLFYQFKTFNGSNVDASYNKLAVTYTDDSGYTWSEPYVIDTGRTYNVTYANGIVLSDADGDGPNVDFVWPFAFQAASNGTFQVSAAYSKDAGKTWAASESDIDFSLAASGHEGGLSEPTITELSDGTLKLFMRCQYGDSYALAVTTSEDRGITWNELAVSSNVASSNTAPTLSKHDVDSDGTKEDVLVWSGNNLLGGTARARGPLNIAWSDDDTETWNQKLNLFWGTNLAAVPGKGVQPVTQPDLTKAGYMGSDDAVISWWHNNLSSSRVMLLEDYTDMLYKTKGGADDFEAALAKYEGWLSASGTVAISADKAADGSRSLLLSDANSTIVRADRTIPALRAGEVSFDLLLEKQTSNLVIELKSAYANSHGTGSVIMAMITPDGSVVDRDSSVAAGTGDTVLGTAVFDGWTRVTVKYDLPAGTAAIYVDGEKIGDLTVNTANGDSITNIQLSDASTTANQLVAYVDNFRAYEGACVFAVPDSEQEPNPVTIVGSTMTLGNDLSLNFIAEAADITGEGWYAEITHKGKNIKIEQSEWVASGDCLRIAYKGIVAKEMVGDVTITIYDGDGTVRATATDSARAYAMRMIPKDSTPAALKTTLVDMLNYGAAAQTFFGYETGDLANSLLTDEQKALATQSVEMKDIRVKADGYIGSSLELENNIKLKFIFSGEYVDKTATVTYTDHYGKTHSYEITAEQNGSYAQVCVETLVIADCSVPVTVTIGEITVVDSVESYCARMETLALREPLMKFTTSARAYFKQ